MNGVGLVPGKCRINAFAGVPLAHVYSGVSGRSSTEFKETYVSPLSYLAGGKLRHVAGKWSAQATKQGRKELGN